MIASIILRNRGLYLKTNVEIKDASKMWGHMTLENEIAIAHDIGLKEQKEDKPAVVNIGPAGENLVRSQP
jgi:aldehyde:ferredoxin oxidoreductase